MLENRQAVDGSPCTLMVLVLTSSILGETVDVIRIPEPSIARCHEPIAFLFYGREGMRVGFSGQRFTTCANLYEQLLDDVRGFGRAAFARFFVSENSGVF